MVQAEKNGFKYLKMMWIERKSHGPDVEMIFFMPIAVAVESKPTTSVALKEVGQVIKYVNSGQYDAVILRITNPPYGENAELSCLKKIAENYGFGIICGGSDYSPLNGSEKVVLPAKLKFNGNPAELYDKRNLMKIEIRNVNSIDSIFKSTLFYRRYFKREVVSW